MADLGTDAHLWGEGAKQAGYIRAMLAKDMGKTRKDYDPVRRKKQIGRFDINKMSNPSDNLRAVYMDKHKAKPAKTWEQVKAEASDLKHAVATWVRMNPNKSEREIARDTGVSQPSINRWKKLTGGAKIPLTAEQQANRSALLRFPQEEDKLRTALTNIKKESEGDHLEALASAEDIPDTEWHADDTIRTLMNALGDWETERNQLYDAIMTHYEPAMEEAEDDAWNSRELEEDPTDARQSAVMDNRNILGQLKNTYIKVVIVIKQIKQALIRHVLSRHPEEPRGERPTIRQEFLAPSEERPLTDYPEGTEFIEAERKEDGEEDEPTEGGNSRPNSGYYFAKEYERRPVRGGAKPMKRLYRPNGMLFKGNYHIMPDGKVHSGIKHTKSSQLLIIK